jgi:glycosyltransferase involved in cell wall biosynthesis
MIQGKTILINYQGRDGAGPVCALEWAKGFLANNCQVYVAISYDVTNKEEWVNLLTEDHIFWVHTYKNKNKVDFVLSTFKFMTVGKAQLRKKFQGVHFDFTLRTLYSHWAYLIDRSVNHDKIVTLCHDPKNHSGEKKYISKLYHKHVCQSNDVFVLTKSFIPFVHENYAIPMNHIHYVPHGRMEMYKEKQIGRRTFEEHKTNFVFFGRVEKYKGLDVLAKACILLRERTDKFTVLIAGSGNISPYLSMFNQIDCVDIENRFIPDEEVGTLFDGPNIVTVVPYIDATQSGVIPIAYEYETPIIASDTGGLREQLDNGRIGVLFECCNAYDLAKKMELFVNNPNEAKRQIELMRDYRETLNWDIVAKRLIDELYD